MRIEFARKALKQLAKLPLAERKKVTRKLRILKGFPFEGKKLGGELEGRYSLKVWPYRIIYTISKDRLKLTIRAIKHRQEAYKN